MANTTKKLTIVIEDMTESFAAEIQEAIKSRLDNVGHAKYTIKLSRDNKPKQK